MQPPNSVKASVNCDLSEVSLEEAVLTVWKVSTCTLTVSPSAEIDAKKLLKFIGADSIEHPLTPVIHLVIDPSYARYEWSLAAAGKVYWSPGVI